MKRQKPYLHHFFPHCLKFDWQLHHLTPPFSTAMVSWQPTGELVLPDVYLDKGAPIIYVDCSGLKCPNFISNFLLNIFCQIQLKIFVLQLDGRLIIVREPLMSVPHFVATHFFWDIFKELIKALNCWWWYSKYQQITKVSIHSLGTVATYPSINCFSVWTTYMVWFMDCPSVSNPFQIKSFIA